MKSFYEKTVLDNGITILTERMDNVRSVALGIWVGAGSRDEPDDISGVSHFIEHLMFKGTPDRSAREIAEHFESMGAELNAFTAKESTTYFSRMQDEHLPDAMKVLADMVENSSFAEKDISAERRVVLEEISLHDDSPDELIHDLFGESVFANHPLGKKILGTRETVKNISREQIIDFYKYVYSSQDLVISAAGHLEHKKVVDLVKLYFEKASKSSFKRTSKNISKHSKLILQKRDTEQAHICLGVPGLSATDKKRFVVSVLDNIVGGGMSARLFWEIREKLGLAYSVYSYHSVHTETGAFCMYAGTSPKNVHKVIDIMLKITGDIKTKTVSDKELNRAKQHIKGQLVLGLESTSHRMMRLGKSELSQQGTIYSVDELVTKIDSVSKEDIKELASKLFEKENFDLAAIGPFSKDEFSNFGFKKTTII